MMDPDLAEAVPNRALIAQDLNIFASDWLKGILLLPLSIDQPV